MVNQEGATEQKVLNEILDRCRRGDRLAWEWLVRRYQSRVFAIAFHYTGNREDARDLAQDIFVKTYQNLDACTCEQHFLPWLIRIARNSSVDFLRRRKSRPRALFSTEEMNHLVDAGEDPEEKALRNSRVKLFYRALHSLTRLNREILLLKEIQGLKLEEIAEILRVPLGTLKSRCHRARIELAERVTALLQEEGAA